MIPTFITVRTSSTRLPNKCLMDFGETSVIGHVIKRCQYFELSPIVCTTTFKSDDVLEDIAGGFNVPIFRGALDPRKRWFDCARFIGCESWHSLDCDDPFFAAEEIEHSYSYLQELSLHCVLPTKSSASGSALVGTSFSLRQGETKILPESRQWPQIRMTLDYPEDYWFLRTLVRAGCDYKKPRRDIDMLIDTFSLTKINSFRTADWKENQQRELVA